ncbi:MAG TPA: dihydrofolate reductase family protein [Mucilaginibacter sp.]|jgi:dihydrofolate reductase
MRKIIVSNMVSLDGYIEGPNKELNWHVVNDEFFKYSEEMLESVDIILFGRVTYQMMASYWTKPEVKVDDPIIAGKMNSLEKIVFSKTLDKVEWENSSLVKDNIKEAVLKLKQQPGKDMVILGSGSIVSAFTQMGIIDEYRIIINPVILGAGKLQFTGSLDKTLLKLTDVRKFSSGVIILYYQPIQ